MIKDYILIIFRNFTQRKLRGWLTILGILIGITAVVSLVSLGQGLENYMSQEFEAMGSDKIMVMPGSGIMSGMMGGSDLMLTPKDKTAIEGVKGVKLVGGWLYKQLNIKFNGESATTLICGLPQDETKEIMESMSNFQIAHGRDIKEGESGKATIGIMFYEDNYFEKNVKLRDTITIKDEDFEVVGVVNRIGNPGDDSQIYVSLDDARDLFNEPEDHQMLLVQIAKGADADSISEAIEKRLRGTRDVEEGDENFNVQTMEDLMETISQILGAVQAVIVAIAAISLLVGGVGIMNTMYTSVVERTREIGIMKAIGAKNSDILNIFLIESGLLGLAGGVIGAVIGIGISKIIEWGAAQSGLEILRISVSPSLIAGVLFFSFAVGALSGALPAYQASKMKPVDALRYE